MKLETDHSLAERLHAEQASENLKAIDFLDENDISRLQAYGLTYLPNVLTFRPDSLEIYWETPNIFNHFRAGRVEFLTKRNRAAVKEIIDDILPTYFSKAQVIFDLAEPLFQHQCLGKSPEELYHRAKSIACFKTRLEHLSAQPIDKTLIRADAGQLTPQKVIDILTDSTISEEYAISCLYQDDLHDPF